MINYLWAIFIIVGFICSIISGNSNITDTFFTSGSKAIDIILNLVPLLCLWLGTMKIAEVSGLLDIISKRLSKFIKIIFPEIPDGDPAIGYISSNILMNMFGLGNAATPFGLKAMRELKRLNNNSDIASRSMITFLVINTSSVTIIPTTVISLRIMYNSIDASEILGVTLITTFLSTILALVIDRLFYFLWRKRYA